MPMSSGVFCISKLAIVFAVLCSLYLFRDIWLPSTPKAPAAITPLTPVIAPESALNHTYKPQDVDCQHAEGADRVMVVLKTGASEIYEKLPTHLVTLFRCTPHFLIFSDTSQKFSDYQVHDALQTVSDEYKDNHSDFEVYRKLHEYQREGQNVAKLKGNKGWALDKWKFLPMMHESYRLAPPEVDWFVYMEADTSLSWTNLLQFLGRMDPKKPLYMGAQNVLGYSQFAHGGSGFIVSREAASRVERKRDKMGAAKYDERWELSTANSCCGDELIARALYEADVKLTMSWPRIQGETVATLDWTKRHWCTPAITWHHVTPAQVDSMWQFQTEWVKNHGWSTPYLYRDVFEDFITRHISVNRTSWNNLSKDQVFLSPEAAANEMEARDLKPVEEDSIHSFEACAENCASQEECVQWMYQPGMCKLGKAVRLGESDDREGDTWTSGWMTDRIRAMSEELKDCKINWDG